MKEKLFGFLGVVGIIVLALAFSTLGFAAEKVLKIGTSEDIRDWDGHRGTGHYEPEVKNLVYDRLIATKPGTWEIVPGVAKSWEFSKDRKEITFHLQQGMED